MVYIDAVHYETDIHGCRVITKVKWTNNLYVQGISICTKEQMISHIKGNPHSTKTKYYRAPWGWIEGEDVRVVDDSYLRTDSNSIKADNLGELPEF